MSNPQLPSFTTAISCELASCSTCQRIQKIKNKNCLRCGTPLHLRKPYSLQRTWAFTIAASILYIPANTLAIMDVQGVGGQGPNTIMQGVIEFWHMESYFVASVIFTASVIIPLIKLLSIMRLCIAANGNTSPRKLTKLYRFTEFVGRWSMIDIFVVAILISLVQLDALMTITPGPAALAFASVVILTMFAAMSFDPRLLWDAARKETNA